ncbi:hypothetical protein D9615_003327 [Tricholomella constricta]|uniref:Uncharacterized protein n=1 Tax=Tricholomella constricta TaxID=117010 RepID=A0A8H5M838_9AGAR|nr:hypothetical protein D9615_003327 [Tricholomella constricta]
MLDFLSRWLHKAQASPSESRPDDATAPGLPFPVVAEKPKSKWTGRDLQLVTTSAISHPIPPSSPDFPTGFDISQQQYRSQYLYPQPSPTRAGPSNVAWVSSSNDDYEEGDHQPAFPVTLPRSAPPAVIRLSSQTKLHPIGRSVSSPPTSPTHDSSSPSSSSSSSFSGTSSPKWNLKLNTNPAFSQSTRSLRLDARPHATTAFTDVYGHAYNYPLVKQLSPIAEQDYFSPISLRNSKPFPGGSVHNGSTPSVSYSISNATNASPGGSQTSEITRPSPSYSSSHPFITRQLNRTISQTSSRTHVSTTSSVPRPAAKSTTTEPPTIPPLNLTPPFPGPHPSRDSAGSGPPLRPRRSTINAMPTIAGSSESAAYTDEEQYGGEEDLESLHAESFVTASDAVLTGSVYSEHDHDYIMDIENEAIEMDIADASQATVNSRDIPATPTAGALPSVNSGVSGPSASESFITRRWEQDASFGSGVVTFRAKRQWLGLSTPAFWAFWLGFVCPFLWLVGGWHFTRFGEQPPRLSFWEFYFFTGYWRARFCCWGKRTKDDAGTKGKGQEQQQQPRLPRWVTEKQSSDDGRMRLQDPKRSLRGISFGYPFIPRPVSVRRSVSVVQQEAWSTRVTRRIVGVLEKPNRLFNHFYGVKLREVRGRPESGRRIFDPWIQRCRYAFCYALILLCVGLCSACAYLIVFNTRQLR